MKTSIASPSAFLRRVSLTLAVFAVASCAADELTGAQTAATPPMPLTTANASAADGACAAVAPTQTLVLENGANSRRLGYFNGCGWKYLRQDGKFAVHPTALSATSTPATPDPMAVFIDGPTGYAFAWTGDAGWEFIGHVTDGGTELQPTQLRVTQR